MKTKEKILNECIEEYTRLIPSGVQLSDFESKRDCPARRISLKTAELYSDQFKPKWIPIKERLPEEGQIVDIFSIESGRQTGVVFENGYFITYPEKVHRAIKHPLMIPVQWTMIKYWMPIEPLPTKP